MPRLPIENIFSQSVASQPAGPVVYEGLPARNIVAADACMFAAPTVPPLGYPASNNPEVWLHLRELIRHSPTLQNQLSLLRANHWTCIWNHGQGSRCEAAQKHIHIDLSTGSGIAMQHLAHEASHVFDTQVPLGRFVHENDFLRAMMHNEARAVISHLLVREEILRNGGVDIGIMYEYPQYYVAALNFYGRHHSYERLLNDVASMYLCQTSSLENLSYWHTYGNAYRGFWNQPPMAVPAQLVALAQTNAWHRLEWEMKAG